MTEGPFTQANRTAFAQTVQDIKRRQARLLYLDAKPNRTAAEQAELDAEFAGFDEADDEDY